MYSIIIPSDNGFTLKIFKISNDYERFYKESFQEMLINGNPYSLKLALKFEDKDGKTVYEDYIDMFIPRKEYSRSTPTKERTYPSLYIINKSKYDYLNGSFKNDTIKGNLEGMIGGYIEFQTIQPNNLTGPDKRKRPDANAVTSPFIFFQINGYKGTATSVRLRYEGLINISDIKLIKNAKLERRD